MLGSNTSGMRCPINKKQTFTVVQFRSFFLQEIHFSNCYEDIKAENPTAVQRINHRISLIYMHRLKFLQLGEIHLHPVIPWFIIAPIARQTPHSSTAGTDFEKKLAPGRKNILFFPLEYILQPCNPQHNVTIPGSTNTFKICHHIQWLCPTQRFRSQHVSCSTCPQRSALPGKAAKCRSTDNN